MARLILDTNALVRLDRQGPDAWNLEESDDIAIGAITLAELRHGVLAADNSHRPAREKFVRHVEETVEVLPYTRAIAAHHAALLDHVRRVGRSRGAHDLIIAAHARHTGRQIVSSDLRARFGDLPGVYVADDTPHDGSGPTLQPPL